MSKVINSQVNNLRFTTARNSGNLVAIYDVDGVQYRSSTRVKVLPRDYDKKIFVATDENDQLITNDYPTPNGTILKMVPFEGFDGITSRELITHAGEVKFGGNLGLGGSL